MTSVPRSAVFGALFGVVLACLAALWAAGPSTRELGVEAVAEDALDDLALLASLRDERGQPLRGEPMAVEVIQDGGPMWVREAVIEAVEASPDFAVGNSPHLLRVEVIDERAGVALQLHLWRAGWDLRMPEPRQVQIAPWAAVVGMILGALAGVFARRVSVTLVVGGVCAQLLLALDPLPEALFPPKSMVATWTEGPLLRRVLGAIDAMSSVHLAMAAAVVAASLVLVAFDHRNSRERDDSVDLGSVSLAALLGSVGSLAWLEAASRGSLLTALGHPAGWLALLGLALACGPVVWVSPLGEAARKARRSRG